MGTAVTTVAALGLAHIDGVVSSRDVGLSVVPQLCHIRSNEHDLRGVPTVWLCAPVDVGGARLLAATCHVLRELAILYAFRVGICVIIPPTCD